MSGHVMTIVIDNDDPDDVANYILFNCRSINEIVTAKRVHEQKNPWPQDTPSPVTIDPPDPEYAEDHWTISGDLRHPEDGWLTTNHEYSAKVQKIIRGMDVQRPSWGRINFDSESSCFYAYAYCEEDAKAVAKVAEQVWKEGPLT